MTGWLNWDTPRHRLWPCRQIVLFALFSVLGWGWEVLVEWVAGGAFVNRGFLSGPYLPIYGFGLLGIAAIWSRVWGHRARTGPRLIQGFCLSVVLATGLEWLSSWIMELLFHRRWWDYRRYPLNLDGRVCLYSAVLLGFGGILGIWLLIPAATRLLDRTSPLRENYLALLCLTVISLDLIHTLESLIN